MSTEDTGTIPWMEFLQVRLCNITVIPPVYSRLLVAEEHLGGLDVPCCSRHTSAMQKRSRAEVAAAVKARRLELQLTPAEVIEASGVSAKTYNKLEDGTRWPQERSRLKIEPVLQWRSGSIENLLAGGEAEPTSKAIISQALKNLDILVEERSQLAQLVVDLAIEADGVDTSASKLDTTIKNMDDARDLVDGVETLLIDIDRLTQHIHDEALRVVGGDKAELRRLKADSIARRRAERLNQLPRPSMQISLTTSDDNQQPNSSDYAQDGSLDDPVGDEIIDSAGPEVDDTDHREKQGR
jgi:transcriptional regulator with XRE-family HTH domain